MTDVVHGCKASDSEERGSQPTSIGFFRAVSKHDLRLLRREPGSLAAFPVMSITLALFLRPIYREISLEGVNASSGAMALARMATLFGLFIASSSAFGIFRERTWNTWSRLRVAGVPGYVIVLGKGQLPLLSVLGHLIFTGVFGYLLFDLRVMAPVPATIGLLLAMAFCFATLSVLMANAAASANQLNIGGSLMALLISGFGGALTPLELLPDWVTSVARFSPAYWSIQGLQSLSTGDGDRVAAAAAALVAIGVVFGVLASFLYRVRQSRS